MNGLRAGLLSLLLALAFHAALAQVVDKVRLSYDSTRIQSKQTAVAASGNGQFIAFAYQDLTVKVFDVSANKFVAAFQTTAAKFFDIKLTHNGDVLILLGDSTLQFYNWKQSQTVATFRLPASISKSAFNDRKGLLAIGMKGGQVSIYNVDSLKIIRTVVNEGQQVSVLAISPNGSQIVVGSMHKFRQYPLCLYDVATGKLLASSKKAVYTAAFFDESGTSVITSGIKVKSATAKVGTAIAYFTGIAFVLLFVSPGEVHFDEYGNPIVEENKSVKLVTTTILGAAVGIAAWKALRSKTVVRRVNGVNLQPEARISKKKQFARVTYYLQGTVHDSLALMMTHTQSFDVFNIKDSRKLFTTTEDHKSFKASIDYLGVDQARIFQLGNSSKYLINTYRNNINQIYDAGANAIVGYIFTDSNEDFAVVARDGRVDGTQNALSKIFWTAKNSRQRTPLESNFEKGFTPRLLNEIIYGEKMLTQEFNIDEVSAKIPTLRIQSINGSEPQSEPQIYDQKNLKIKVQAIENPAEITELRLYQNGKLVATSPRSENGLYEFAATLTSSFGEDNFFYCSAQSKSNIESQKQKFVVRYKGTTEAPTLYLITVGINEYLNPKYNLNYARPDADGIEQSLKQTASSLTSNIVTFPIRDDRAVKANVLEVVEEISKRAKEQDIFWFYYAGHGVLSDEGMNSEFFIVPHDVVQLYGKDHVLREKAISAAELKTYSQSIKAQKQIFILDACHSGGALNMASTRGGNEERAIAQLARSTGTFWLTSSGSDQFASELEKLGHGIFTYALLEGLGGDGDANKDQKLTIRELSTYVENKVPELSEKYKGVLQFPAAYSFGNDFPIALYK